jgi:LPS sulfotransferase NodH
LWHEDVLTDPSAAVRQVADHLRVDIDPSAAVQVPEIHKQSVTDASVWIERYARSRTAD